MALLIQGSCPYWLVLPRSSTNVLIRMVRILQMVENITWLAAWLHLRARTHLAFARLSPFADVCSQMEAQRAIWERTTEQKQEQLLAAFQASPPTSSQLISYDQKHHI